MTDNYKLSEAGLNQLISSPVKNDEKAFIRLFLKYSQGNAVSVSELAQQAGDSEEYILQNIESANRKGWLCVVEGADSGSDLLDSVPEQLRLLAAGKMMILVDDHGLVIADSGCEAIRKHTLSAKVTHSIKQIEQNKTFTEASDNQSGWGVKIKWGEKAAIAQMLYTGARKFVLISAADSSPDKKRLIELVALLVRRYESE